MKNVLKSKIIAFIILIFVTIPQISCDKNENIEFIEFTKGFIMDPDLPRTGIKITSDNYVYYCEEVMNPEDKYYLNKNNVKYKFFKSQQKIDFSKFKEIVLKNFSNNINKKSIVDDTYCQIYFNINNKEVRNEFYESELNSVQFKIGNEIWNFKNTLTFKPIDSIYFSQERLQERLPEPPPLE